MSTPLASKQKGHEQGVPLRTSWKVVRRHNVGVLSCNDDGSRVSSFMSFKATRERSRAVSYTHLTLPTNREV